MKIRILDSAKGDLEEGYRFYDSQECGIGDYFISSVSADIERLRISAGMHPIVHQDYHRALCRTFPFAVYYTKSGDVVTVYAVVDCRRDPVWIHHHLEESSG
jgi:hypothetical protein